MKVMITGGTGFVGSNLARGLVADGHDAVAYDLTPTLARIADNKGKVRIVRGDICDLGSLIGTMKEYKIDRVMHLAAYLPESEIRKNPTLAIRRNAEGTNNVFEAAPIRSTCVVGGLATYLRLAPR